MTRSETMTPTRAAALLVLRRYANSPGLGAVPHASEAGPIPVRRSLLNHRDLILQTLRQAARHAWLALETALAGKVIWDDLCTWLSAGDARIFRQQVEALLDLLGLAGLSSENPADLRRCFDELRAARRAGLATIDNLDPSEIESEPDRRNGYPTAREPDERQLHLFDEVIDSLRHAGHPILARLVGLRLPWGGLLFLEVVEFFARDALGAHPVLRRELPDAVEDRAAARWRCLEMMARLLNERAVAIEALLDNFDPTRAASGNEERDDEAVERFFRQGLARVLHGDHYQAVAHFTAALKLDPTDARLYAHRGDAYRLQGENERAIADFEAAIRLDPSNPSLLVRRAAAYYDCGEHSSAVTDSGAALRDSPSNALAYRIRGAARAALGSRDSALADLTAAIGLAPADEEAHFQRGLLHAEKRDYARAVADFNRVLKLNRHRVAGYFHRAQVHRCLHDYDAAVHDFSEVLRYDPSNVAALAGRGSAYRLQGDFDRALADYERALVLEPNNSRVRCSQGVLYRVKGELRRAKSELDEAVRVDPNSWSALYHRGKIHVLQGQLAEALTDLTAALSQNARILVAYLSRAIVYDHLDQHEQALADSTQAVALDERSADARLVRGIVRNHAGKHAAAVADLTEAIRLDPRLALAYHERSVAYTLRREFRQALADCNRLLALEPGNARAYAHRSLVYQSLGDVQKALVDYNQALRLDPRCFMTALDQGLAEASRQETTRRLADHVDGLLPERSAAAPPPPAYRIIIRPWPKGSVGVSRTSGGDAVPWMEPSRSANCSTGDSREAAQTRPTRASTSRPPGGCQSVPSAPVVFLNPLERPVYSSAERHARVDDDDADDEQASYLERWRKPALVGVGIAALVLLCFCFWFKSSDHVRVYPARGQASFDGKPIAGASIRLEPTWTKNPVFPQPRAIVKDDGSFVLETYGKEDGAPAGEYRVSVQWLVKTDKAESEGGTLPQNMLPPKYAKFETSGISIEIREGENTIPAFQLKR